MGLTGGGHRIHSPCQPSGAGRPLQAMPTTSHRWSDRCSLLRTLDEGGGRGDGAHPHRHKAPPLPRQWPLPMLLVHSLAGVMLMITLLKSLMLHAHQRAL